jgi:hypothetical protein
MMKISSKIHSFHHLACVRKKRDSATNTLLANFVVQHDTTRGIISTKRQALYFFHILFMEKLHLYRTDILVQEPPVHEFPESFDISNNISHDKKKTQD